MSNTDTEGKRRTRSTSSFRCPLSSFKIASADQLLILRRLDHDALEELVSAVGLKITTPFFKERIAPAYTDGRTKAIGGKRRIIHAERAAAWDAKNRYGLPEKVPMQIESLAPLFAEPAKRPGWRDRVAAATTVEELGRIGDDADQAVSNGRLSPAQREQLDAAINERHAAIETEVTA